MSCMTKDNINTPVILGYYVIEHVGIHQSKSVWYPNENIGMSREEQIEHNKRHFPDFKTVKIFNVIGGVTVGL